MFYEFMERHTPCLINGTTESVVLSRETKATTVMGKEYVYNGLFAPTSIVKLGDLVETDATFMVLTMRQTVERDKYCSLLKSNAIIEVQRYDQEFDSNDNPVGAPDFITAQEGVVCFVQYVTADLRQQDQGLLPTTKYLVILQTSVDVKRPQGLPSPDRIIIDGQPYQVDVVDSLKYPSLLNVQVSEDTR
ncbi:hypothetical protein BK133_05120 [Paenibacillus sp. FSL H8-0548]|uniref:hypothetical protein n=1 Tax=Paenibacillus sp. FSL H8-0548 TaxID=1920422 RepID=UPI00096F3E4A|nr:hypothetical protein [Paenibacillus sp. FSL H8-0548]OMF37438.1 hypothetical protein BK133_05120 [Paenibacillus sp. FSL H8-0548]